MNGTITVTDKGALRVHTYTSPDASLNVTTQLIETPQRVIAVDGQYALADADEVVAYANSLGKPIDRVIITHAHPDHFQGAGRFGAPIHALAAVRDQIAAQGDGHDPSGAVIPVSEFTPQVVLEPGPQTIDGVELRFEAYQGGEATDELVILLPEHGILIAQDLVYHRIHLFLGNNDVAGWQAAIAALAEDASIDTVLPGHGLPAGRKVFTEVTAYLNDAAEFLADGGDAYKAAITRRHPDWGGATLIDIANEYLFPEP